jgi:hypothetical protein
MRTRPTLPILACVLLACPGTPPPTPTAPDTEATTEATAEVTTEATAEVTTEATAEATPVETDGNPDSSEAEAAPGGSGLVFVVLFTHIEDNDPPGMLGTQANRDSYLGFRAKLIEMGKLAKSYNLQWVLQPDWKILEAALLYEDAATMADTGGKNFLVYLRDELGVAIDPHSHEEGGYNYTDVAHLLDLLGVGGSTVIGGHVWDPALNQFSEWDRFRKPVAGLKYPDVSWRGDILIGAGTPGHTNDPLVSGVWRPKDRDHFFIDAPAGNIVAIGHWHDDVAGVEELLLLYAEGSVSSELMLTASWNVKPSDIKAENGLDSIAQTVLVPMDALRDQGKIVVTDFTTLVKVWHAKYRSKAHVYQP